jgi:spore coat polysaccharide biosynthesis predicted glycosyltransferase SpsG
MIFLLKKQVKIYIRSKGGLSYGWGHVIRSLSLAQYLIKSNKLAQIFVAIEGDSAVCDFIKKQNISCSILPVNISVKEEEHELKELKPDVIVVDMLQIPMSLLSRYRVNCHKLIIFNDLGVEYKTGDIIINPQLLPSYPPVRKGQRHLSGTDYYIISENILKAKKTMKPGGVKPKAKKLLIVMGGSIKKNVFEKIIKIIENLLDLELKIDFVLGYDFDFDLAPFASLGKKGVSFVYGTDNIGDLMTKADQAFASSGYVKYELAALGVPAILISVVDHQEILGSVFAREGKCADYIGDIKEIDAVTLAKKIKDLSRDQEKREIMSKAGRQLVDGNALERIEKELILA